MSIATHHYPDLALHARALLTPLRAPVQVALQRCPLSRPSCCGDPECDEETAWSEYLTIAQDAHAAEAFDLALERWKIAKRECLLRQANRGMRTWASVGEFLAKMKD